nr:M48 family metallopeptidase [Rhabdothermincola salaria]
MRVPADSTDDEVAAWAAHFAQRFQRRYGRGGRSGHTGDADLQARADTLARRYDLPRATSVRWVTNQRRRWGSCTPATGEIRLSHRLQPWPTFVADSVLVHELAHLVEPNHSKAFRALEARYPLLERANGFLLAQAYGAPTITDGPAPQWCDADEPDAVDAPDDGECHGPGATTLFG